MNSVDDMGKTVNVGVYQDSRQLELERQLEHLALLLAETWKEESATTHGLSDFKQCVNYVTQEMAEAATLVGGVIGLEILTGGGSKAACTVCRHVLSASFPDDVE